MEIVKVFKSTNNPLPVESTPKSAAKDLRVDLKLCNIGLIFNGTLVFVKPGTETGAYNDNLLAQGANDGVLAILLEPMGRALIPSGLKIALPEGHSMDVRPRSGLALKYGIALTNSPGLVDEDYRGDVGVIVQNTGYIPVVVVDGDRLGQIKLVKDIPWEWSEVQVESYLGTTVRGEGGFNSTGTK